MSVTTTPHSHGAVVPQSSRAEWFTSFDVDAFEVPGGREEIWRFTPVRRLRDLHNGGAPTGTSTVDGGGGPWGVGRGCPRWPCTTGPTTRSMCRPITRGSVRTRRCGTR